MVRYLDQKGTLHSKERDKLLFWYLQAAMWGRFSGSTETFIDQDFAALEGPGGGVDKLIEQLRLWRGGLRVEPQHFTGWSVGARFYSILYMLTRMGDACDWGNGLPLKAGLLGKMNRLEVQHIFPKSRLYQASSTSRDQKSMLLETSVFLRRTQTSTSAIGCRRNTFLRSKRHILERGPLNGYHQILPSGRLIAIAISCKRARSL